MRIAMMLAACLITAACSTTPVTPTSASSVPPDRLFGSSDLRAPGEGRATVTFVRDGGLSGSGCDHELFIGKEHVATIRPQEKVVFYLPAGDYFFRLDSGRALCPNVSVSQSTRLAPNGKEVYRILMPADSAIRLTRIE